MQFQCQNPVIEFGNSLSRQIKIYGRNDLAPIMRSLSIPYGKINHKR